MPRCFGICILLLLLYSCGGDRPPSSNASERGDTLAAVKDTGASLQHRSLKASAIIDDWVIIPGTRIGLLNADASEADIRETYGEDQVARRGVGVGERQTVQASVLFPDQPDELVLLWRQDAPFERVAEVRAYRPDGRWHGTLGVKVGLPIEALREINGKDFAFHGFEWDYSGLVNDWQGGAISGRTQVYLAAEHPEALLPELLGDEQYPWNHPQAEKAGLKVGSLVWMFDEENSLQ